MYFTYFIVNVNVLFQEHHLFRERFTFRCWLQVACMSLSSQNTHEHEHDALRVFRTHTRTKMNNGFELLIKKSDVALVIQPSPLPSSTCVTFYSFQLLRLILNCCLYYLIYQLIFSLYIFSVLLKLVQLFCLMLYTCHPTLEALKD